MRLPRFCVAGGFESSNRAGAAAPVRADTARLFSSKLIHHLLLPSIAHPLRAAILCLFPAIIWNCQRKDDAWMSSMLSKIKSCFVPAGKKPRTIKTGPFKGIRLNLDLQYQTQMWLGLQERELHSC